MAETRHPRKTKVHIITKSNSGRRNFIKKTTLAATVKSIETGQQANIRDLVKFPLEWKW